MAALASDGSPRLRAAPLTPWPQIPTSPSTASSGTPSSVYRVLPVVPTPSGAGVLESPSRSLNRSQIDPPYTSVTMPSDLFHPRNVGSTSSSATSVVDTLLIILRNMNPLKNGRSPRPSLRRPARFRVRVLLPFVLCSASFFLFVTFSHVISHQTRDLVASPSSHAAKHGSNSKISTANALATAAATGWMPHLSEIGRTIRPSAFSLSTSSRMTDSDRMDMIEGIEDLLEELPVNWPTMHWCEARNETLVELEQLRDCLVANTCRKNQASVVVGGSYHFGNSVGGHTSGEDIWARSSIESLRAIGHTVIYAYELTEMLAIHDAIGSHIPIIIMEGEDISRCVGLGIPRTLTDEEAADRKNYHTCTPAELDRLRIQHGLTRPEGLEIRRDGKEVNELGAIVRSGWRRTPGDERLKGSGQVGCVKRDGFEGGIPVWKMFAFHFWTGSAHPLGNQWTLSPEDYRDVSPAADPEQQNFYLGYSIERVCSQQTFTPTEMRMNRAFVYGKTPDYLSATEFAFFDGNKTFVDLKEKVGMEFTVAMGEAGRTEIPDKGLINIGSQTRDDFLQAIGRSSVMLGLGRPWLSPTPYDALCMGTPFINPIIEFDAENPEDRSKWISQQEALRYVDEPFVYHVRAGDLKGLEEAVVKAKRNPLKGRYIPPWMTEVATKRRHRDLVDKDWKSAGEARLDLMRAEVASGVGTDVWAVDSMMA